MLIYDKGYVMSLKCLNTMIVDWIELVNISPARFVVCSSEHYTYSSLKMLYPRIINKQAPDNCSSGGCSEGGSRSVTFEEQLTIKNTKKNRYPLIGICQGDAPKIFPTIHSSKKFGLIQSALFRIDPYPKNPYPREGGVGRRGGCEWRKGRFWRRGEEKEKKRV